MLNVSGTIISVPGCKDSEADNYNPDATEDDGSCENDELTGVRYVDEVFNNVIVSSNVMYGSNIGIITQAPAMEDLYMDVYEPFGDEATDRRVVIMLHTGSFLPAIANGQATGDKSDASIVEMCTRFAKKGYVAIAVNYRLGWNPISPSEDVRRSTLIQAAYRGLQDTKTAVRFLRKSATEDGNPYGVGDQFAVGGHGTGGYLSLAMATLNNYESELLMPKFIDTSE
jgi:acetyl esterase/lipase